MIENKLFDVVSNHYILPYINILKDNQYLIIYNNDIDIIGRFRCEEGKVYEIYNIFHEEDIETYIEDGTPKFSVFEIENKEYIFNIYKICERKEYVKRMKECLSERAKRILNYNNDNTLKLINKCIEEDGGKIVSFPYDEKGTGILLAACVSDEDIYYVYFNTDMIINITTCVSGYDIIDADTTNEGINKLLDIQKNNPSLIQEKLNKAFEDRIDYIFTNIKISRDVIQN